MVMTGISESWVVFDIDGVVADTHHRIGHLTRRPSDWDGFFAAAVRDPPLPEGIALVHEKMRTHRIAWLTGRPDSIRLLTTRWLEAQGLPHDHVYMRSRRDRRPAAVFKAERLAMLTHHARIDLIVDDDPAVVRALRLAGWLVLHATWALPENGLHTAQRSGRT